MKNSLLAVVLFMAFTTWQLNAQTQTSPSENLSDSSRALQFQVGSNFNLYSFQCSVVSYKHHLSRNAALRLGLSISLGGRNDDYSTNGFYADSNSVQPGSTQNSDRNNRSIQLTSQYIWYFNHDSKLLLYGGAGPLVGYDYRYENKGSNFEIPANSPLTTQNESKAKQWTAGITGVIGVEWFASKSISLLAEYGLQASYYWLDSETKDISSDHFVRKTKSSSTSWDVRGSNVKLGLSLYF